MRYSWKIATKLLLAFSVLALLHACNRDYKEKDALTREERAWLNQHPNIKIAVSTTFPPFQFNDDNLKNQGISIDFLDLIEKKIDFRFQRVYFTNWENILEAGKTGKVDVILEIQENEERRKYFNFTHPFIEVPHVIIMRKSFNKEINLSDLKGMSVAVPNKWAIHDYLRDYYPDLNLVPLVDHISCLRAVSLQKVDAMVGSQGISVYLIQQEAISNLQIVGNSEYNNVLAFAVRKDWPILTRIIDKGLSRITQSERQKIFNKWLRLAPISFWKQSWFWIFVIVLGGTIILIISLFALWNQTLQRKISVTTAQLQRDKEKAEESNRLKTTFLANMSHEIRTPLNAIQGFSELLTHEGLDQAQKMKYADIIDSNCRSLTHLIDEILDLSKIETGQIKIQKEKFNLLLLAEEMVQTYSNVLREKPDVKITLTNHLQEDELIMNNDPQRLKQVLNNLISNAVRFTPHGTIEVGLTQLSTEELLVYIRDSGIGIDPEALETIFDRFSRAEKETAKIHRGSGLGLHISRKLLDLMGGKIWAESEPGKGSTFYFTLPKQ